MLSSLSSGVTGLESFQEQMDVIGNNIANINTTAFKAGIVNFADAFSNTLQGAGSTTPAIQVGTGVEITSISNNWAAGGLNNTGVPSNLAISGTGNGFFEVQDPVTQAIYLTQDGTFSVNANNNLVTANGDYVLGTNGATAGQPLTINIASSASTAAISSYTIDSQGHINVTQSDGTTSVCGQVMLVNVTDPQMLVSEGDNRYSNQAAANGGTAPTLTAPGSNGLGTIQAGALESSNVDLSNEMANLITAQRAFEANSKIITTTNEVLQTLVQMKQS
ncbi:MAG: flagellar hook-basal body protein [Limisphaerales bacterium]